jgi:integrase/recombinase XerC
LLDSLGKQTGAVFVNQDGERITSRSVGRMVKELAGNDAMHPHVFRHAFATHLLADGCDLISLAALMGHSAVTVTQRYTHLDLTDMRKALQKAHPLA